MNLVRCLLFLCSNRWRRRGGVPSTYPLSDLFRIACLLVRAIGRRQHIHDTEFVPAHEYHRHDQAKA